MKDVDKNAEQVEQIMAFKKKRRAVILVHNYQRPEVQDIGDFVGDSLELSQKAARTDAEVIVFCGVQFMAETAFILSPDKTVLLPDSGAGCPMADMITAEALMKKKKEMPGSQVVCYVNSSAAVKAESDICCTSANAVRVVQSLPPGEIIFVPDQYLGHFAAMKTGREMTLWPGYCPTHVKIQPEDIIEQKKKYPGSVALAHPECRPETREAADEVMSTGGMIRYSRECDVSTIILATETGILHRLNKENPGKNFVAASRMAICPNMKKITLEKVLWSLEEMNPRVTVPEEIRVRANIAVERMISL